MFRPADFPPAAASVAQPEHHAGAAPAESRPDAAFFVLDAYHAEL